MGEMRTSTGALVPGSSSGPGNAGSSSYGKAKEVTEAEEARRRADAWSSAYFKHLGVGSGLGGAADIEKYKVANPGWEKGRDAWAQSQSKVSTAKKAKGLAQKAQAGTGSIGGLMKQE